MHYLLLSRPRANAAVRYRGIDRFGPVEPPLGSAAYPAWEWYTSTVDQRFAVSDLAGARNLEIAYTTLGEDSSIDVVLPLPPSDQSPPGFKLLGLDLALGSDSLLSSGLIWGRPGAATDENYRLVQPMLSVVGDFFRSQLNESGLFDALEVADRCLGCVVSADRLRPGLFEGPADRYEVVAVWRMTTD